MCSLQPYARSCKFALDCVIVYYVLFGAAYLEELGLGKGKTLLESRIKTRLAGKRWGRYVACYEIPDLRENVLSLSSAHLSMLF